MKNPLAHYAFLWVQKCLVRKRVFAGVFKVFPSAYRDAFFLPQDVDFREKKANILSNQSPKLFSNKALKSGTVTSEALGVGNRSSRYVHGWPCDRLRTQRMPMTREKWLSFYPLSSCKNLWHLSKTKLCAYHI